MDIATIVETLAEYGVSFSIQGEKLHVEHESSIEIAEETWEELRRCKGEIIAYLLTQNQPEEPIPQSFLDRPCYRCGGHKAVKRPDGVWVCPCYFVVAEENAKPRPNLSSIDRSEGSRELASRCSLCSNLAEWYGAECVAYCDRCWRRLGFLQWYHRGTPQQGNMN